MAIVTAKSTRQLFPENIRDVCNRFILSPDIDGSTFAVVPSFLSFDRHGDDDTTERCVETKVKEKSLTD